MSATDSRREHAQHLVDLMASVGPVKLRPMFGGHGLFLDGLMFALIAGDRLYFKVDDQSVGRFNELALQPLTFQSRGRSVSLRYHEAPAEAYENADAMVLWAREAMGCARRADQAKALKVRSSQGRRQREAGVVSEDLAGLRNLGPRSVEMLLRAGIATPAQLRTTGAVLAYVRTKAVCPQASLNLLWALEGALTGRPWQQVAESDRASLLMALEDVQRHLR